MSADELVKELADVRSYSVTLDGIPLVAGKAISIIGDLRAEIARLSEALAYAEKGNIDLRKSLLIAAEKLAARERLAAALKPFAEVVDEWKDEPNDLCVELQAYDDRASPCVSLADFREARAALASAPDVSSPHSEAAMSDTATQLQCIAEDDTGHIPVHVKKLCASAAAEITRLSEALAASEAARERLETLLWESHSSVPGTDAAFDWFRRRDAALASAPDVSSTLPKHR